MLDLSLIGKNGMIFQYEDIISLTGFNIIRSLKPISEKVRGMSDEDILTNYFNRSIQDPSEYIKTEYGISIPEESIYKSKIALKPNMLYAYRIIDAGTMNGMTSFYIHSNQYSEIIEENIKTTLADFNVKYVYGDIVPILRKKSNFTYLTSDVNNINKCMDVGVPFALTIVDEYGYTNPCALPEYADKLREKGIYVAYTGIISAGIIFQ